MSYGDRLQSFNRMLEDTSSNIESARQAATQIDKKDPIGTALKITGIASGGVSGLAGSVGGIAHYQSYKKMYKTIANRLGKPNSDTVSGQAPSGDNAPPEIPGSSGASSADGQPNVPQANPNSQSVDAPSESVGAPAQPDGNNAQVQPSENEDIFNRGFSTEQPSGASAGNAPTIGGQPAEAPPTAPSSGADASDFPRIGGDGQAPLLPGAENPVPGTGPNLPGVDVPAGSSGLDDAATDLGGDALKQVAGTAAKAGADAGLEGVGASIAGLSELAGPAAAVVGLVGGLVSLGSTIADALHKKPAPTTVEAPAPAKIVSVGANLANTVS